MGYIANPVSKIPEWRSLSPLDQLRMITKWSRDMARNFELGEVMEGLADWMKGI
jgi:hypothetical protein